MFDTYDMSNNPTESIADDSVKKFMAGYYWRHNKLINRSDESIQWNVMAIAWEIHN